MKRCTKCVMPSTRPDTYFNDDGVCSACLSYEKRKEIDWGKKEQELCIILEKAEMVNGFDCIVPSSGGKDSTYQVLKLIELGAKPLIVTATTCHLTDIGRKNIDNLSRYATTIEVSPCKKTRNKLNKLGLELVGDISWPEHVSIFTTPFRIAVQTGIPLIFYGESPQNQYGGPEGTETNVYLNPRWRSEFGGFLGLRPSDIVGQLGITKEDMYDYEMQMPRFDAADGPVAYFLGQFIEWDSHRNAKIAKENGLKYKLDFPSEANWHLMENLDNAQTGLHDYMMYRKYGYGRACAQISVDIRYNRFSREMALQVVKDRDGIFPDVYMGVTIEEILERIAMTRQELDKCIDKYTNKELFPDGTSN